MRYKILLLFSVLLIVSSIFAQKIDYKNIDYPYLEQLIKKGIDSLRNEKRLPGLMNDSVLYLAAKDHAEFLLKTDKVGHDQKGITGKETPHKRIAFYGGKYSITGENVAKTYLFVPVKSSINPNSSKPITDYKTAALELVQGWKNSKGHYKNIILPDYNITSVAVSYNPKTKAFYAVQTFAKTDRINSTKIAEINILNTGAKDEKYKAPQPHKRHAYNIKSGEKIEDRSLYDNALKSSFTEAKMYNFGDSIVLSLVAPGNFRKLFKHKKDGLTLEFITFSDYFNDSIYYTKPSRRNGACIFNGIVSKPLYKADIDKLIKEQSKNRKSENLLITFKSIPKEVKNDLAEINLIILNKNKIVDVISFNHILGANLYYPISTAPIPDTFNVKDVIINYKPDFDTLNYKVFFERNVSSIDYLTGQKLREKLIMPEYKPKYGIVTSYSSIEGPEENNILLYQQRADNLIQIIKEELVDSFPLYVHSKENWDLFKKQIQKTQFEFLRDTTNEFVKLYLSNEESLLAFDKQLKSQRYVNLYLVFEEIVTEQKKINSVIDEYTLLFNTINSKMNNSPYYTIDSKDLKNISDMQHFIFGKINEGKLKLSILDSIPIMFKVNKASASNLNLLLLEHDCLKYKLYSDNSLSLNDKYNLMRKLAYAENSDSIIALNYCIMTINRRGDEQINSLDNIDERFLSLLKSTLDKIGNSTDIPYISDLRLFYHGSVLDKEYQKNPMSNFAEVKSSIKYIYDFFSNPEISEIFRFQTAKYLTLFNTYDYSQKIITDLYMRGTTNKEIIRYYVVMLYSGKYQYANDNYELLFFLSESMSTEEWCKLFTDRMRFNIQILDFEFVRDFYCTKCGCN